MRNKITAIAAAATLGFLSTSAMAAPATAQLQPQTCPNGAQLKTLVENNKHELSYFDIGPYWAEGATGSYHITASDLESDAPRDPQSILSSQDTTEWTSGHLYNLYGGIAFWLAQNDALAINFHDINSSVGNTPEQYSQQKSELMIKDQVNTPLDTTNWSQTPILQTLTIPGSDPGFTYHICTYLKDQQGKPQVALGSSIESTIKCPAADEIKTLNQHINQFDADYSHDYQGYHINSASKGLEIGSYPSLSAWLKVAKQRLLVIRTNEDQSVDPKNDASSWFQTPQPYYVKDEKPRPKVYLAECIYRFNQGQPQVVLSTSA